MPSDGCIKIVIKKIGISVGGNQWVFYEWPYKHYFWYLKPTSSAMAWTGSVDLGLGLITLLIGPNLDTIGLLSNGMIMSSPSDVNAVNLWTLSF
jgi:hypothetical protein